MKRLALVAAAAVLVCTGIAFIGPAIAQQQAQQSDTAKQQSHGRYAWSQQPKRSGVIGSPNYTIHSEDGDTSRATDDDHAKSKGGDEIQPTLQAHQKQWTSNPFRLTPSGNDDSSTTDGSNSPH